MNRISVAIATYNEEKNIQTCLNCIQGWVYEIVLVDGDSTDKTVYIAKKYNINLIKGKNEQMFHNNKQKAIDACTGEWILQLDADEIVTDELREEMLSVINQPTTNNHPQINGYWIPRRNYFLGKFLTKGGQYPDYTMRLYRRGKGRLPCKSVHEQAIVSGETGYLTNALYHYPYPDFSHYLKHFNLYTDIFAQELKEKDESIGPLQTLLFMVIKPKWWFLRTYIRHKGFMDGFAGFVFCLFSSLRFPVAFIKYWEMVHKKKRNRTLS